MSRVREHQGRRNWQMMRIGEGDTPPRTHRRRIFLWIWITGAQEDLRHAQADGIIVATRMVGRATLQDTESIDIGTTHIIDTGRSKQRRMLNYAGKSLPLCPHPNRRPAISPEQIGRGPRHSRKEAAVEAPLIDPSRRFPLLQIPRDPQQIV